ncbi:MAG: hypothetical protein DRH11_12585 [Deltaproteobacteria bacterium]|nr:MAG: hypothetical protein DRH11_12585 [Deltaproteobacteria bacterium]
MSEKITRQEASSLVHIEREKFSKWITKLNIIQWALLGMWEGSGIFDEKDIGQVWDELIHLFADMENNYGE